MLTLLAAAIGAVASLSIFTYVRGNFSASAVMKYETSMAGYRRLANVAFSQEGFNSWVAVRSGIDTELAHELGRILGDSSLASRAISPFFRVTKRDLRDMPPTKEEEQLLSQLLGVQLEFNGHSPAEASDLVKLSADYLRDLALWDQASEYVRYNFQQYSDDVARLDNQLLRRSFEAKQLERKVAELRELRARYPESSKQPDRQLLAIAGENKANFYLSPLAQIVGAESELVDLRRTVAKVQREREQALVATAFFQRAIKDVADPDSGIGLLVKLEALQRTVATEFKAAESDSVREIVNQIQRSLSEFRVVFVEQPLFVTGGQVAVQRVVSPEKAALLGALAGVLLVAIVFVLPRLMGRMRVDPAQNPSR